VAERKLQWWRPAERAVIARQWATVRQKLRPFDGLPVKRRRGDCSLLSLQSTSCYFLKQAAHALKISEKQGDAVEYHVTMESCYDKFHGDIPNVASVRPCCT
jgi:hypothetical protein